MGTREREEAARLCRSPGPRSLFPIPFLPSCNPRTGYATRGVPGPAAPVMMTARNSGLKLIVLSAEPNAESSSKLKQFIASGRVPKLVYLVSRRDSKTCLGRLAEPM